MVDLAMCNLSHDFFRFKDFISTFELILLVTGLCNFIPILVQ